MNVLLYVPDLPPTERLIWTDLATLMAQDDGLAEDWFAIREAINRPAGVYTGGGGAAPIFFLRRI